ncbi:MAG: diaminopimelate decarboxylase, diaminopimelate decarboxylase [Deltaproteobacteria bacterium CSP1-8]|nr:MAG: diaminopimelate decarboxylase, diaminopimelate decarboxylase [Deltaproteobacteria bacterium CSP1-8]
MHHFAMKRGEMVCEGVPLGRIADAVGTPVYVYSHATLSHHYGVFDRVFSGTPHLICYSMKANPNGSIIRTFTNLGSGVDIVSGGELSRALAAGTPPSKIVYSGVGKMEWEIEEALRRGILMFNVESRQELETIDAIARKMRRRAPIALRVNPDVDPKTHPYISTGLKKNKFGIHIDQAIRDYEWAARRRHIEVVGVDCHIGSQLTEISPFVDAAGRVRALVDRLIRKGLDIRFVDIGGGLGITYEDEIPPDPRQYADAIAGAFRGLPVTIILEPGRVLVGNAGVLLTRMLYTKPSQEGAGKGKKQFFIVDAAMNDLARPSLYGSYHAIVPVTKRTRRKVVADVVGPICESGDFLARDRELPAFAAGDLVAVMSAGAYGFSMSSTYNSRPRAAEVMVSGSRFEVVREREPLRDLTRGERTASFLSRRGRTT